MILADAENRHNLPNRGRLARTDRRIGTVTIPNPSNEMISYLKMHTGSDPPVESVIHPVVHLPDEPEQLRTPESLDLSASTDSAGQYT